MTEAKPEQENSGPKTKGIGAQTVLLMTVIVGFFVFAGIGEHLRPEEARFLNQVIEPSPAPTVPQTVQSMWADFCGLMERPSRLLGLISGIGGLILLIATIRNGGGSTFLALAVAGAMGIVLKDSITIGGSAIVFLAVAACACVVQRVLGLSLRVMAFLSIFFVVGCQYAMGLVEVTAVSPALFWHFGPDLTVWGLPLWLGPGLLGLALAGAFLSTNEPDGFLVVVLGFVATYVGDSQGFGFASGSTVVAAYTVPVCLWFGVAGRSAKWQTATATVFCGIMIAVMGTEVHRTLETPRGLEDRAALDWVAKTMPATAWLALDGPRKDVLRYYEHCGHRTGHRSILIRDDNDLQTLIEVALYEKPPRICFFDVEKDSIKDLMERFVLKTHDHQPSQVTVASFKRRS